MGLGKKLFLHLNTRHLIKPTSKCSILVIQSILVQSLKWSSFQQIAVVIALMACSEVLYGIVGKITCTKQHVLGI